MVSFSCENCGDVLTKKKLDPHRNQCRGASFTCIDCMVHFQGTEYRAHTSCMSEAQKYQGALYREKEKGKRKSMQGGSQSQAMVPRNAYVEDAPEDGSQAVAVIDVPPRAPTPPPAAHSLPEAEGVNVFDFLVSEPTPNGKVAIAGARERKMLADSQDSMYANGHGGDSQYSQYSNGDGRTYAGHGFSYGDAPVVPGFERYDSWHNMADSQASQGALMPPPYTTPAPKKEKRERGEKSDKKRKRTQVDDLDLSAAKRPVSRGGDENMVDAPTTVGRVLHSGLTGGLHKLVTDPDFYEDRIDAGPTPISPIKRSKRGDATTKEDKRKSSRTVSGTTTSSRRDRDRERETYHDDRHRSSRARQPTPSSSPEPRPSSRASKTKPKAIEYPSGRASSVQPTSQNQVGHHFESKAEHFLSFINKGPDSERGLSINKALKRYHRERGMKTGEEKEEDDKELWKGLRLRRNSRGEVVLFI